MSRRGVKARHVDRSRCIPAKQSAARTRHQTQFPATLQHKQQTVWPSVLQGSSQEGPKASHSKPSFAMEGAFKYLIAHNHQQSAEVQQRPFLQSGTPSKETSPASKSTKTLSPPSAHISIGKLRQQLGKGDDSSDDEVIPEPSVLASLQSLCTNHILASLGEPELPEGMAEGPAEGNLEATAATDTGPAAGKFEATQGTAEAPAGGNPEDQLQVTEGTVKGPPEGTLEMSTGTATGQSEGKPDGKPQVTKATAKGPAKGKPAVAQDTAENPIEGPTKGTPMGQRHKVTKESKARPAAKRALPQLPELSLPSQTVPAAKRHKVDTAAFAQQLCSLPPLDATDEDAWTNARSIVKGHFSTTAEEAKLWVQVEKRTIKDQQWAVFCLKANLANEGKMQIASCRAKVDAGVAGNNSQLVRLAQAFVRMAEHIAGTLGSGSAVEASELAAPMAATALEWASS